MTTIFADQLRQLMDEQNLSVAELAVKLSVSGQTVKNALDGKSINARFLEGIMRVFDLEKRPKELHEILLGMIALICDGIEGAGGERGGDRLLEIAGLRSKRW